MTKEETEALLRRCKHQDRNAQKQVYENFYGFVYSIVRRYCPSTEETKECTNDVFFKIFDKIDYYKAGTQFKSWIGKIAVRTAIDRYRAEITTNQSKSDLEIPEQAVRFDYQILDKIDLEEKVRVIQKLSPAYRTVFNLYVFEQYTHEEIAGLLNISEGTSKSNLAKARQQLKQLFAQYSIIE